MWKREDRQEQFSDMTWRDFSNIMDETPLPMIPQITYPFGCANSWIKIINSLPAGKAVGPCGWSNDELKALPYCCIEDLSWIFQKIASVGFDIGFMMAKTVLLAKVPVPLSMNHARPITILSCLYRLFGRFDFRHTASVWKQYLPFPARIMCRLGMPAPLLEAWIASLDRMVRYPHINGHVTMGIGSTTGVPEGCSISVLSMLATSSLYYYRLVEPSVKPFAYADNWSWMSSHQRSIFLAYQKMLQLVEVMRLKVDFKKSWHWGTSKSFREFYAGMQKDLPGHIEDVAVRSCVKDLGELVHYNRSVSLGHIKEKIEEGVHRIQRIEWLPCDLHKKALFIQTPVWPFALYSCDTTYIGQKHFDKLRRATVNALVGHWHNASPMLACNFLSKFLMDPFLYTLCQCIRIVRRLATVQHDLAVKTVQTTAAFDGNRPFGPATSFRHYLNQVGWELDANGVVTGPDHLQF